MEAQEGGQGSDSQIQDGEEQQQHQKILLGPLGIPAAGSQIHCESTYRKASAQGADQVQPYADLHPGIV